MKQSTDSPTDALAEVLGLTQTEFEIYRDYQAHGAMDGDRLLALVKHEARRRAAGRTPVTGAMIQSAAARP